MVSLLRFCYICFSECFWPREVQSLGKVLNISVKYSSLLPFVMLLMLTNRSEQKPLEGTESQTAFRQGDSDSGNRQILEPWNHELQTNGRHREKSREFKTRLPLGQSTPRENTLIPFLNVAPVHSGVSEVTSNVFNQHVYPNSMIVMVSL